MPWTPEGGGLWITEKHLIPGWDISKGAFFPLSIWLQFHFEFQVYFNLKNSKHNWVETTEFLFNCYVALPLAPG